MEWANTLKGVSADFAGKNQWDSAFEKIEEGRKVLDELNQVCHEGFMTDYTLLTSNTASI